MMAASLCCAEFDRHLSSCRLSQSPFLRSRAQACAGVNYSLNCTADAKRTTRLNVAQHTHQTFRQLLAFNELPHPLFLRFLGRGQMNQRTPIGRSHLFRVRLYAGRKSLHETTKVFVKNPLTRQETIHPLGMTNRTQVPRKRIRSNPAILPTMRLPCRFTNRSITRLQLSLLTQL